MALIFCWGFPRTLLLSTSPLCRRMQLVRCGACCWSSNRMARQQPKWRWSSKSRRRGISSKMTSSLLCAAFTSHPPEIPWLLLGEGRGAEATWPLFQISKIFPLFLHFSTLPSITRISAWRLKRILRQKRSERSMLRVICHYCCFSRKYCCSLSSPVLLQQ